MEAYQALPERFEVKIFDYDGQGQESSTLGAEIKKFRPHTLVFADHQPHPLGLIKWMLTRDLIKKNKDLLFHIYGDYTFYYLAWHHVSALLNGHKVKFIVSSERQKRLVQKTIKSKRTTIEIFPFLVNTQKLSVNGPEFSFRKKLLIPKQDICFLYTGRISLQKNIEQLLHCFRDYCSENQGFCQLILAGGFDDLGPEFFNKSIPKNFYYQHIQAIIKTLPVTVQKRIHFLGKISFQELMRLYQEMDIFISLSLYHDEDFGMSPAEALCNGMPAILSDWGGYHSFRAKEPSLNNAVKMIPVHLTQNGLELSQDEVVKRMFEIAYRVDSIKRKKLAKHYCDRFGISTNVKRLARVLEKTPEKFDGLKYFNYMTNDGPRFEHGPTLKGDYKELYESYATSIK